jgi:2OG-Fe(II) oxygenase superfamily
MVVDTSILQSPVLARWIDPKYLSFSKACSLVEAAAAKPDAHYLVIDDFFSPEAADRLRVSLENMQFSEDLDRRAPGGNLLPYDSAVKFADSSDVGWELFSDPAWHTYLATLVSARLHPERHSMIKLRRHRADAGGFWIHSDAIAGVRSLVAIAYFNPHWNREDGGLLQIWREDGLSAPGAVEIEITNPEVPLHVLTKSPRIRTRTPGERVPGRRPRDFVLVDQIVPEYNRLFVCNIEVHPGWHAVTPSRRRPRYGFVQWVG